MSNVRDMIIIITIIIFEWYRFYFWRMWRNNEYNEFEMSFIIKKTSIQTEGCFCFFLFFSVKTMSLSANIKKYWLDYIYC